MPQLNAIASHACVWEPAIEETAERLQPSAVIEHSSPVSELQRQSLSEDEPTDPPSCYNREERESLFADFQPLVRRLIRQYGEDPEFRQDLMGEIYCRFSELLDAFDPERGIPLRPYLVRSLTASVYTYSRSYWRRRRREVNLDATVDFCSESEDNATAWDQRLMTQEVLRALPAAIAQLPLRQRQVVIWRYYESRSYEEIAELAHIRPATARSLLRHGLNNLRRQISSFRIEW